MLLSALTPQERDQCINMELKANVSMAAAGPGGQGLLLLYTLCYSSV